LQFRENMENKTRQTIAILGGGPAGSSTAIKLARQGHKVGVFHTGKRPPLIVGESLLPAVIPMLRELGVEEEIKSFSKYKPGATVTLSPYEAVTSFFSKAEGKLPDYAYNTPRDKFDQAILDCAKKEGVKIFPNTAKVEVGENDTVRLSEETLLAADGFFENGVDWIIDASGRARTLARTTLMKTEEGDRKDWALFAHWDKIKMIDPGNIHVDFLEKGWSWRIPLPDRVSLGVVINPKHLQEFGNTPEEQYDNFVASEPQLIDFTHGSKRLTPVVKFNNWQNINERFYGKNWVCIGDAAGFIDPVFSTGLYLSMKSAFKVADIINKGGKPADFEAYEQNWKWEVKIWRRVIDSWYNGRLFTLYRAGMSQKENLVGRVIAPHVEKHLSRVFTGDAINGSGYSRVLHRVLTNYFLMGHDPAQLTVK